MLRTEWRPRVIKYCDLCGREINDHTSLGVELDDGRRLNFHNVWVEDDEQPCWNIVEQLYARKLEGYTNFVSADPIPDPDQKWYIYAAGSPPVDTPVANVASER